MNNAAREQELNDALDTILASIKKAANRGEYTTRITDYGFSDTRLYLDSTLNTLQTDITNELHTLGYQTQIRVEEKQFTDIYLEVSW